MLSYTDEEKKIIRTYDAHKDLKITFLDDDTFGTITNDRIYWESLKLIESLCDNENLIFGSCESTEMQIQVADIPFDIKNHEIQLDLTIDGIPIPLGIFFIANVEKATDKRYKILTCYDRMYYMQTDVIEWYNSIFSTVDTTMTLKQFRDSFFEWIGIEQEVTNLVNDDIIIRKTIDATELSGLDVIKDICEINGAFGHINRYGIFEYKYLENHAIYPSETLYPQNDLYPGGGNLEEVTNAYYIPPSEQNDYTVRAINKLQIRQEEGDIGAIVTAENYVEEENNGYIVNSNFLVYGNNAEELKSIAEKLSTKIFGITYTPNSTNTIAMPYMEVGDGYFVNSKKTPFISLILKRTISGIQGMRDLWEAKGEEFQPEIIAGNNQEIIQLRSRVNVLTRNVDETISEIQRVETDLSGNVTELNTRISQTATELSTEVNRATTAEGNLSSKITQTAESITAEVNRATTAEGNLSTRLQITENGLTSKVEKNNVISSINQTSESITIDANKLNLQGITTFLSDSGYVTENDLGKNGTTVINGGRIDTQSLFSRDITATNFKLEGNSSLKLGANNSEEKQYIYLVGEKDEVVYETGMFPSRFYTLSNNGYSMNITASSLAFGTSQGTSLRISTGADGVAYFSAGLSQEFMSDVVMHNKLMYIAGGGYHDIIKIIQNNIILGNLIDYTEG